MLIYWEACWSYMLLFAVIILNIKLHVTFLTETITWGMFHVPNCYFSELKNPTNTHEHVTFYCYNSEYKVICYFFWLKQLHVDLLGSMLKLHVTLCCYNSEYKVTCYFFDRNNYMRHVPRARKNHIYGK